MKSRSSTVIILFLLILLHWDLSCNLGLDEVEGFSGRVSLPVDSTGNVLWPDSLKTLVIVVAEFGLYDSLAQFLNSIVTFSDPLDTTRAVSEYFIQTLPGVYIAGLIGLKLPVNELLFLSRDSLKAHAEYFVPLGLYAKPGMLFSGIEVTEDHITPGIDLQVDYHFSIPFR